MRHFLLCLLGSILLGASGAAAGKLDAPKGKTVLTISGDIKNTNAEGSATFDLQMLKALPSQRFDTTTIWTEGKNTFVGVPLAVLLEVVGVEAGVLRAKAINDYSVEIPVDETLGDFPIVAYEMDGRAMSRRQKGPLWIVYPYDSDVEFRSEMVYSRSIWQLDRLEVVK